MSAKVAAQPQQPAQVRAPSKKQPLINDQIVEATVERIGLLLTQYKFYADAFLSKNDNKFLTFSARAAELARIENPGYEVQVLTEKEWDVKIQLIQNKVFDDFKNNKLIRDSLNQDLQNNYNSKLKEYSVTQENGSALCKLVNEKMNSNPSQFKHIKKGLALIASVETDDFKGKNAYKSIIIGSWLRAQEN